MININYLQTLIGDKLIAVLTEAAFDGHDYGSGEVNFFIFTHDPMQTFKIIKHVFTQENVLIDAKIAYRETESERFTCIWPEDLTEFNLI